ncbi:MAG: RsmB/NOP family class I SAM-dependent RNA methyltransferase [Saprospiraceae bacterium]
MQNKQIERLYPNLVGAVVTSLQTIFTEAQYAVRVIERMLKSNSKWGSRDRAFIAESVYEIVRWYRLLYAIRGRRPWSEADWWEMFGIWQIINGKRLPDWEEFSTLDEKEIRAKHAELILIRSIKESIPNWLDELGAQQLGAQWDTTLTALNKPAEVVIRVNLLKTTPTLLAQELAADDILLEPLSEEAFIVKKRKNLFATAAFKNGWFELQDFSSQQVAHFLEVQPGMRVVDACAGAGGKSLHMGVLMENKGQIIGMDTEAWKLDELKRRARRNGIFVISPRPITDNKVIKRLKQTADRLLLDVPCSGLGVLRRNPDAKWKLSAAFLEEVQQSQANILKSYANIVKPGGKLVYATCSILPAENENQVQRFLEQKDNPFVLEEERKISPLDGFDGFYMARLRRE